MIRSKNKLIDTLMKGYRYNHGYIAAQRFEKLLHGLSIEELRTLLAEKQAEALESSAPAPAPELPTSFSWEPPCITNDIALELAERLDIPFNQATDNPVAFCKKYGVILRFEAALLDPTVLWHCTIEAGHMLSAYVYDDSFQQQRINAYGELNHETTMSLVSYV